MNKKIKDLLTILVIAITNIEMLICGVFLISNYQSGYSSLSRCLAGIFIAIQIMLYPHLLLLSDLIQEKNYKKALERLELKDVPSPFSFKWHVTALVLSSIAMYLFLS